MSGQCQGGCSTLREVKRRTDKLNETVYEGNGRPPLKVTVAESEKDIQKIQKEVEILFKRTDSIKDNTNRSEQNEKDIAEEKKHRENAPTKSHNTIVFVLLVVMFVIDVYQKLTKEDHHESRNQSPNYQAQPKYNYSPRNAGNAVNELQCNPEDGTKRTRGDDRTN